MAQVNLVGNNLGERHRCLNKLVKEAFERNDDFTVIQDLPEALPIDRLFKIDLASKFHNTEYILKNLNDADMLYVSRALKSKWLLQNEDIINPKYLEENMYPGMVAKAVAKMKKWIFINLKNETRCKDFYLYYYKTNYNYAMKFLKNCSIQFIRERVSNILLNISPRDLEILCEKDSEVGKVFFSSVITDNKLKSKYIENEKEYFDVLKKFLKTNPEFVLDTMEKIFNINEMKSLNRRATKFIMKNHKQRFFLKPELYVVYFLHIKCLPKYLTNEELINLVLQLSQAKYLDDIKWFNYKTVEPFLNNLKAEDKLLLKKKIFIEKKVEEKIQDWPYKLPSPPEIVKSHPTIFDDVEEGPDECIAYDDFKVMLKKRKYAKWQSECKPSKTLLDKLYNEFRCASFSKTYYELQRRIKAESSLQNRQFMVLVLVSKSGEHEKNIHKLMELLQNHRNEPSQFRATIVRSLFRRAHAWRLSNEIWRLLIEFAQGLGLDGKECEIVCEEGIHASVIRELLKYGQCQHDTLSAFLKHFSTLNEYALSAEEKCIVSNKLPDLIFNEACDEENISQSIYWFDKVIDILDAYKIPIVSYNKLVPKIEAIATVDVDHCKYILYRLFKAKIARQSLFRVNFKIMQTECSYLNALRHDIRIIEPHIMVDLIINDNQFQYQKFFSKIIIYFKEKSGLVERFLDIIKAQKFNVLLAKPLILLMGDKLMQYIENVDSLIDNNSDSKKFANTLRVNAHLARPLPNIDLHWLTLGVKAIANKVTVCRDSDVNNYVKKLLQNKRTMMLAIVISKRNNSYHKVLTEVSKFKPRKVIQSGLNYLRNAGIDLDVWFIIKPLIENLNIGSKLLYYKNNLADVESIPMEIRPEYIATIYKAFKNISPPELMTLLFYVENILPTMDEEFISSILQEYLRSQVSFELYENQYNTNNNRFIRIIVKYLLLCKSEETQNTRLKFIGNVFLDKMEEIWSNAKLRCMFWEFLDEVFAALKYNKVFLSLEYVCCVPVMEAVLSRLKRLLPLEKHFEIYAHLHLIMLYYKAVQKNISIMSVKPEELVKNEDRLTSLIKLVGHDFGKYISLELCELKTNYFDSIEHLYSNSVLSFFSKYLENSCITFIESTINGILDQSNGKYCNIVGLYLLREKYNFLEVDSRKAILEKIKYIDDHMVSTFLFSEIL